MYASDMNNSVNRNSLPAMPPRRPQEIKTYLEYSLKEAHRLIMEKCGNVYIRERHGKGPNKVIILPEAFQELKTMISYGRRSPMNEYEQKYTGFGHILITESNDFILIVSHFIEIQTMNRNPIGASNLGPNGEYNPGLDFLEYHREEFLRNESKYNKDEFGYLVDPFLKLCGASEFVLEGHTHPDLGVFYSQPDRTSGAARAASTPICIFVCDPVRKEMLGSIGASFFDAEVIVYDRCGSNQLPENVSEGSAEGAAGAEQTPLMDEIARLVSQCLHTRDYFGHAKTYTRLDGRTCMKIKVVSPKDRSEP